MTNKESKHQTVMKGEVLMESIIRDAHAPICSRSKERRESSLWERISRK